MGRKPVTVKVSEEVVERLDSEAEEQGDNRSEYIRTLLRQRHGTKEVVEELSEQTVREDELREEIREEVHEELEKEYRSEINKLKRQKRRIDQQWNDQLDDIYAKAEEILKERYQDKIAQLEKENKSLSDEVNKWKEIVKEKEAMAKVVRTDDMYEPLRLEDQRETPNKELKAQLEQQRKRLNDLDGSQRRMETKMKRMAKNMDMWAAPASVRVWRKLKNVFTVRDKIPDIFKRSNEN